MHTRILFAGLFLAALCRVAFSWNEPDGYAAVRGKGLRTTTGGEGGKMVTVTSFSDLSRYAGSSEPYVILVDGQIRAPEKGAEVDVASNKTIVGLGNEATLSEVELHLINVNNVIIRNLTIRDSYVEGDYDGKENDYDGLQADACHHLWIDHCHFTHCGDGLIDLRKVCDYVTISWVHLSNHNKAFGLGWTEETDFRTTIHHCWFDNTNQRNPSFDMGIGHLYNNYVSGVTSYGNLARGKARVIIENSFFEDTKDPVKISDEAKLYITGLEFIGCEGSKSGNVSAPPYDIGEYYEYSLDATSEVKRIVTVGAGPQEGIGEWYLDPTGTDARVGALPKASPLVIKQGVSGTVAIRTTFPGRHTVLILTPDGRTVAAYHCRGALHIRRALPGKGIHLFSVIDKKSGNAVRSVLISCR